MRSKPVLKAVLLLLLLAGAVALSAADPVSKPKKKMTLHDLLKATGTSSRRATTVAGVRGLDEMSGDIDTQARDYEAVDRLEKMKIQDQELKDFLFEGLLK